MGEGGVEPAIMDLKIPSLSSKITTFIHTLYLQLLSSFLVPTCLSGGGEGRGVLCGEEGGEAPPPPSPPPSPASPSGP